MHPNQWLTEPEMTDRPLVDTAYQVYKNSIAVIVHKWKKKEAVIDQAKYKKIMKDPKLKSIVRQLKEIDDEEKWWLLAESLRAFCSREEIDLIDTVNGWNIND